MKSVIAFLLRLSSIRVLAKTLILGGMGISLTDSSVFFFTLYNNWLEALGLIFMLFSFYTFLYITKLNNYKFPSLQSLVYFLILKLILYAILLSPFFIDEKWKFNFSFSFQNRGEIKALFEFLKVIGMELLLELYFSLTRNQKG